MISFVQGELAEKNSSSAVINTGGLGYDVAVNLSTFERLGDIGGRVKLYVSESVSMYGGGTVLYGFLTKEEKEAFICFKENIPNTGAKKALDYLDKAFKSFGDFKNAVSCGDVGVLVSIFGFTKKTAEKIISSLKGKISDAVYKGGADTSMGIGANFYSQSKAALQALGYNTDESDSIISAFSAEELKALSVEEFVKEALRKINR